MAEQAATLGTAVARSPPSTTLGHGAVTTLALRRGRTHETVSVLARALSERWTEAPIDSADPPERRSLNRATEAANRSAKPAAPAQPAR